MPHQSLWKHPEINYNKIKLFLHLLKKVIIPHSLAVQKAKLQFCALVLTSSKLI